MLCKFGMSKDSFFRAYVECALWSSTDPDDNDRPLDDKFTEKDIDPESLAKMRADCDRFFDENQELLQHAVSDDHAGHDLWLSRNGHGAGYFDGEAHEYGEEYERVCAALQAAAERLGTCDIYPGDPDGEGKRKLYISP